MYCLAEEEERCQCRRRRRRSRVFISYTVSVRAIYASVNILCMFANVQNLKMVFVMSNRTVPVAAARLCHSVSRRPEPTLPVVVHCLGRCCCLLAVLVSLAQGCCRMWPVARCCPCYTLIRQPKVSDQQMILLKVCMSVCACVFG